MRYEGKLYRPPSEHDAYILQATIGCSHNKCTYCDMYRDKKFRVRSLDESLSDLNEAGRRYGDRIEKLFVADGDALILDMDHWREILETAARVFPKLRRVSCYAMASNVLEKSDDELRELREGGLSMLYIGPESGDPETLRRIVKGSTYEDHVEAAKRAKRAGMRLSVIALLGAGGVKRSAQHARATADLVTDMDPEFFSALTLTVIPGTPMAKMVERSLIAIPDSAAVLRELRTIVEFARPTGAIFRTNHASNQLPIGGRLPDDRCGILAVIDAALEGSVPLRPDWARGL